MLKKVFLLSTLAQIISSVVIMDKFVKRTLQKSFENFLEGKVNKQRKVNFNTLDKMAEK